MPAPEDDLQVAVVVDDGDEERDGEPIGDEELEEKEENTDEVWANGDEYLLWLRNQMADLTATDETFEMDYLACKVL